MAQIFFFKKNQTRSVSAVLVLILKLFLNAGFSSLIQWENMKKMWKNTITNLKFPFQDDIRTT